jgi:hypothetical protein
MQTATGVRSGFAAKQQTTWQLSFYNSAHLCSVFGATANQLPPLIE